MSYAEGKLQFLKEVLENRIRTLARKRDRDKKRAFGLKILSVCFAGMITVLLGLKVAGNWLDLFQNIALVLGAGITVLNAVEAFYDHRSLWIRRTVTLGRLYSLKTDLDFTVAGVQPPEVDPKTLRSFMNWYEAILRDDLKAWLKLREDGASTADATYREQGVED